MSVKLRVVEIELVAERVEGSKVIWSLGGLACGWELELGVGRFGLGDGGPPAGE